METQPKLNVPALFDHLGGVTAVHKALSLKGIDLSRKAVEKWLERNAIPYGRFCQLKECFPELK